MNQRTCTAIATTIVIAFLILIFGGGALLIYRADQDGQRQAEAERQRAAPYRARLETIRLQWPVTLVIDHETGREYLVNERGGSIELVETQKDIE